MTNVLEKNMFYDSYVSIRELKAWMHQIYFKIQDLLSYGEKKEKRQKMEENEAECVETVFFCYNEFLSKC